MEFEEIPIVVSGVSIDESNFPDSQFRNWLTSQTYGADGVITDEEMAQVKSIVARACGIEDLTGIEHFTALTELIVGNFDDSPQEDWNGSQSPTDCYDLQGRPVKSPTKGIYIQNGKKVLVK